VQTPKLPLGLRRSIGANRNFPPTHFWLAAALGLLGALDEAQTAAKAGLALDQTLRNTNNIGDDKSSDYSRMARSYQHANGKPQLSLCHHYVNAKGMLSLSLLQARLIDLKLPIKIVEGE
jgi:hypothetical protein